MSAPSQRPERRVYVDDYGLSTSEFNAVSSAASSVGGSVTEIAAGAWAWIVAVGAKANVQKASSRAFGIRRDVSIPLLYVLHEISAAELESATENVTPYTTFASPKQLGDIVLKFLEGVAAHESGAAAKGKAQKEWGDVESTAFGTATVPRSGPARPSATAPVQADLDGLPAFHADAASGVDLLGIRHDVDAFARLISSRRIDPPLSIGLFGDWGAGKSFFMEKLRERIDAYSELARSREEPQREIAFYKHVVQVEYNAWHFAGGNLWASIMTHLFEVLLRRGAEEEDELVVRRRQVVDMLDSLKREAEVLEGEVDTARAKLDLAEQNLARQEEELELTAADLLRLAREVTAEEVELPPETVAELDRTLGELKEGRTAVTNTAAEVRSVLESGRDLVGRGNRLLSAVNHASDRERRRLLLAALLVGLPLVIAVVVPPLVKLFPLDSWAQDLVGTVTAVTGMIGAGVTWARRQIAWADGFVSKAEGGLEKIRARIAEKKAEREREHAACVQRLQDKKMALATARTNLSSMQRELAQLTYTRTIDDIVRERAESDDYRKHLGLAALVREDFERLSDAIQKQNRELEREDATLADELAEERVPINRIVLYIDDLDRCSPEKVVEVLQAVHLLLAFPLFVVVVGVDARWVARSLETHYQGLLGSTDEDGEQRATPHDYLEKIFQIPLWLRPLDSGGRLAMIDSLTAANIVENRTRELMQGLEVEQAVGKEPDTDATPGQPGTPRPLLALELDDLARDSARPRNANPETLALGAPEVAFMRVLEPLLGNSPPLAQALRQHLLPGQGRARRRRGAGLPRRRRPRRALPRRAPAALARHRVPARFARAVRRARPVQGGREHAAPARGDPEERQVVRRGCRAPLRALRLGRRPGPGLHPADPAPRPTRPHPTLLVPRRTLRDRPCRSRRASTSCSPASPRSRS